MKGGRFGKGESASKYIFCVCGWKFVFYLGYLPCVLYYMNILQLIYFANLSSLTFYEDLFCTLFERRHILGYTSIILLFFVNCDINLSPYVSMF